MRACRRKRLFKRETARYMGAVEKENWVCAGRKFGAKTQFTCVWGTRNFAILNRTFRFLR